jgi:DNA invertase Pin-like site-specific DNA recombinase
MKKGLGWGGSTQEQAAEGVSMDNQRVRIRAHCSYKGHQFVGIVEDAGGIREGTCSHGEGAELCE